MEFIIISTQRVSPIWTSLYKYSTYTYSRTKAEQFLFSVFIYVRSSLTLMNEKKKFERWRRKINIHQSEIFYKLNINKKRRNLISSQKATSWQMENYISVFVELSFSLRCWTWYSFSAKFLLQFILPLGYHLEGFHNSYFNEPVQMCEEFGK